MKSVIHGIGKVEREDLATIEALKTDLYGQVRFTDLSGTRPWKQSPHVLVTLPPSTLVLYHLLFEDATGANYRPIDALRQFWRRPQPCLSSAAMNSSLAPARLAAMLTASISRRATPLVSGLRYLRGALIATWPIIEDQGNRFVFDYAVMQQFDIPATVLPADSIVKNRTHPSGNMYRTQLLILGVGVGLLMVVMIFLLWMTRQLYQARRSLAC